MNFSLFMGDDSWIIRLFGNHLGYASFVIPIAILFAISKNSAHLSWPKPIRDLVSALIRLFILDTNPSEHSHKEDLFESTPTTAPSTNEGFSRDQCFKLTGAFFGLQISYLLWGLLQERIMTRSYDGEKFSNSQFLVFVNRFLATIIAFVGMRIINTGKNHVPLKPPLYCYGIISYANCMSTWFQYESLLYITFPVQVIAKSIKTIPVMIVGKCVSGKTYPLRQYVLMILMACGIALFLSGYEEGRVGKLSKKIQAKNPEGVTTLNGIILLICYLGFDAFTSNYQKNVFDRYSISFLTMMFFVNAISTLITVTSLIFNGTLWECLVFMQEHQEFAMHALGTSICSSVGQLFIFFTIEQFGPVIFTIIMTMRQAFSIILSCLFYGHRLNLLSIFGINVAFMAIFLHAYSQFKPKKPTGEANNV